MQMRSFFVAALVLTTAACASAPQTAGGAQMASADKNKLVCVREVVVGTRRSEQVCMTVAEREALSDRSKGALLDRKPQAQFPQPGR